MNGRFGASFVLWCLLSALALGAAALVFNDYQRHSVSLDSYLAEGKAAAEELARLEYDANGRPLDRSKYSDLMSTLALAKDNRSLIRNMETERNFTLGALAAAALFGFLAFRSTRTPAPSGPIAYGAPRSI